MLKTATMNFSQDFFEWLEKKRIPFDSWKAHLIIRVLSARNLDYQTPEGAEVVDNIMENIVDPTQSYDTAFKFIADQLKGINKEVDLKTHEDSGMAKERKLPTLTVEVALGTSPMEVVSDLLSDISILYRKMGGSGINFTPEGAIILSSTPHEV